MPKFIRKLIAILDDTPAVYGRKESGQGLVELALVTPLLIVLFASMVEIGWFANNYLILLDATRAGARIGTSLQGERAPLQWNNLASSVPDELLDPADWPDNEFFHTPLKSTDPIERDTESILRNNFRTCPISEIGFYNDVACRVVDSMEPLQINTNDRPEFRAMDDVVVSAFAVEIVHGSYLPAPAIPPVGPGSESVVYHPTSLVPQAVVVGRYPTNANECEVRFDSSGNPEYYRRERDPFDFNNNNARDYQGALTSPDQIYNPQFTEIEGFDPPSGNVANAERNVGFSLFGNHRIAGTACLGSEWDIRRMEQLMNIPNFFKEDAGDTERSLMPSQGIVLVELFWEHKPLLNLPFFAPVFRVFGEGRSVISVWAAFPLPQVEPYIIFTP